MRINYFTLLYFPSLGDMMNFQISLLNDSTHKHEGKINLSFLLNFDCNIVTVFTAGYGLL